MKWDREYAQKFARLWQTMQPETPVEVAILENGIGRFAICDEKKVLLNTGSQDYVCPENFAGVLQWYKERYI